MATLRNKRKLAAIKRDNHEDHPRNSPIPNSISLGIQEDHSTQVSEEIEGRVTNCFRSSVGRKVAF